MDRTARIVLILTAFAFLISWVLSGEPDLPAQTGSAAKHEFGSERVEYVRDQFDWFKQRRRCFLNGPDRHPAFRNGKDGGD